MTAILRPKYIAFDSSSLADLSRDTFHEDEGRQQRAAAWLAELEKHGEFLLLSMSHIWELIAHKDNDTAMEFPKLLARMRGVAWIGAYNGEDQLGDIVDVLAYELRAILDGAQHISDVAKRVRERAIRFGTGSCVAKSIWPHFDPMRDYVQRTARKRANIAALELMPPLALMFRNADGLPVDKRIDPREACKRVNARLAQQIRESVSVRSRDADPAGATEDFLASVARDILAMGEAGISVEQVLRFYGFRGSTLPSISMMEVATQLEFMAKIRVAARKLGLNADSIPVDASAMALCPSWQVSEGIRKQRFKSGKSRASDIHDTYLATLCCYADRTELDKRTFEYLSASWKANSLLRSVMNEIVKKAGGYASRPGRIAKQ